MKLKYKGKEVKIVKSKVCTNCIFDKSCNRTDASARSNWEHKNNLQPCYIKDTKYIYK